MISPDDLETLRRFVKKNGALSIVAVILMAFGAIYISGFIIGFLDALLFHEATA